MDYDYLGTLIQAVRQSNTPGGPDAAISKGIVDDTIKFSSGSGTFKVHMDFEGLLEVNGAQFTTAAIRLELRHGDVFTSALLREANLFPNDPAGQLLTFDEHLVSNPIPFTGGGSGVRLLTDLLATIQLQGGNDDTSMAARSDFLNSARIACLEVRDVSGNLLNVSAVGASGHVYPVNIPEPASLMLLACGALLVGKAGRRRNAPRQP